MIEYFGANTIHSCKLSPYAQLHAYLKGPMKIILINERILFTCIFLIFFLFCLFVDVSELTCGCTFPSECFALFSMSSPGTLLIYDSALSMIAKKIVKATT